MEDVINEIEIDLSKDEYDEQFSSQQLWQQQAAHLLNSHLWHLGSQARECREFSGKSSYKNIPQAHDTIFISGERGTGKSVFLKNAERIWNEKEKNEAIVNGKDKPRLFFAPPIDPTLLQNHDNFTNVIVAYLYNQVSERNNQLCYSASPTFEQKQKYFYDRLRKLAEALENSGENNEYTGLDKVIRYSSGVKIEALFHHFVAAVVDILDCDAVVLPIDDVDMALDQAYPVLEEIRRRFSCPYLIPLVSGDISLYNHLLKKAFANIGDVGLVDSLSSAYLTKVLPYNFRISLAPISDILSRLKIKINNSYFISFSEYQQQLKMRFFGAINGEEHSAEHALPSSAREMVQLLRLLRPRKDNKQETGTTENDWQSLKIWSEAKQHGPGYVLARSVQQSITSSATRLSQLLYFNIIRQAEERLPWAKYDFKVQQKYFTEKFYTDLYPDNNDELLECILDGDILLPVSMPPLEMHTNSLTITKAQVAIEKNRLAIDVYTQPIYYNKSGQRQRKIFFSRAFELLATSLLMVSMSKKEYTEWNKVFSVIYNDVPFYSIHALNSYKSIDDEIDEQDDDNSEDSNESTGINLLIEKIRNWSDAHADDINSYLKNPGHTISLLSAVFKKSFNQIDILRGHYHENKESIKEDQLLDSVLRFHYILINSFGFFIKTDGVIAADLALKTTVATLRNSKNFLNSSNSYNKNVGWIYKESNKSLITSKFLNAIIKHPIFSECGINLEQYTNVSSAKIGPGKFDSMENKKTKDRKRTLSMRTLKSINSNVNGLNNDLRNNVINNVEQEKLWKALKQEVGNTKLTDYPNNHQRVYNFLKSKFKS